MANFTFNVSLGRVAELLRNVDLGSPANCRLVVAAFNTTATDAALRVLDTLAQVEADGNTAEVTNTGYARKVLTADDVTITVDDVNHRVDIDIPDLTWTAVAAGSAWTDLGLFYDPDSTTGTDADLVPLTWHDFAVTPDGSDIVAQINAAGIYRASN